MSRFIIEFGDRIESTLISGSYTESVTASVKQAITLSTVYKISSPDLTKYTIKYPFGDIYARLGLDFKSIKIATVTALTALGNCTPQLKVHRHAALNVGCNEDEIKRSDHKNIY